MWSADMIELYTSVASVLLLAGDPNTFGRCTLRVCQTRRPLISTEWSPTFCLRPLHTWHIFRLGIAVESQGFRAQILLDQVPDNFKASLLRNRSSSCLFRRLGALGGAVEWSS